ERGCLEVELRARAERVGLEPPGDLELAEVLGVDLVERRVTGASQIGAVGMPLPVLCGACLPCRGDGGPEQQQGERTEAHGRAPEILRHEGSLPGMVHCAFYPWRSGRGNPMPRAFVYASRSQRVASSRTGAPLA